MYSSPIPDEHIIKNCLQLLFRICQYCETGNFLKSLSLCWQSYKCCLWYIPRNRSHNDGSNEQAAHKGRPVIQTQIMLRTVVFELQTVREMAQSSLELVLRLLIIVARNCPVYLSKFIVSEKKLVGLFFSH